MLSLQQHSLKNQVPMEVRACFSNWQRFASGRKGPGNSDLGSSARSSCWK